MLFRKQIFLLTIAFTMVFSSACSNTEVTVTNEQKAPINEDEAQPKELNEAVTKYEQGVSLYEANKLDEAKVVFEECIILDPGNGMYDFYIGNILRRKNDFQNAILHYKTSIDKAPSLVEAYNNLTALQIATQNFDDALDTATKGLEVKPDFADLKFKKAQVLFVIQKHEESNQLLQEIMDDPNYFDAHRFLGLNYINLSNKAKAIEHLNKYLQLAPEGIQAKESVKQTLIELEKSK